MIVVTDKDSRVEENGNVLDRRENKMAWVSQPGGRKTQ